MYCSHLKVKLKIALNFTFDVCRPVADWAKGSGVKQFMFISSAGIYKPTDEPPHLEGVDQQELFLLKVMVKEV